MSSGPFGRGLYLRVVSALVAGVFLISAGYFFSAPGLSAMVTLVMVLVLREYVRMVFDPAAAPVNLKIWFLLVCGLLYGGLVFTATPPLLVFALCSSLYFAVAIWITRSRLKNDRLLIVLAMSSVGFLYCVVFPVFSINVLHLPHGIQWFALHLFTVFAGDVFAYFGGILFGEKKLMPELSPKKTVAGAFSGLAGSAALAIGFTHYALPAVSPWHVLWFSILCGFVAQMGDLFVSLFKRVAQIKDSGGLLPGHGGILDRVDGVLITCPLIYAFAVHVEQWL